MAFHWRKQKCLQSLLFVMHYLKGFKFEILSSKNMFQNRDRKRVIEFHISIFSIIKSTLNYFYCGAIYFSQTFLSNYLILRRKFLERTRGIIGFRDILNVYPQKIYYSNHNYMSSVVPKYSIQNFPNSVEK